MDDRTSAEARPQTSSTPSATTDAHTGSPEPSIGQRLTPTLRQLSFKAGQSLLSPFQGRDVAEAGLTGGSRPVPHDAAARVTAVTGVDVSHARLHTGPEAVSAATGMGAQGYTLGSDVALASSDPAVMYHELGHVAQQAGRPADQPMAYGPSRLPASGDLEAEADRVAELATAGGAAGVQVTTSAPPEVAFKKPKPVDPDGELPEHVVDLILEARSLLGERLHESDDSEALKALRKTRRKERRGTALGYLERLATLPPETLALLIPALDAEHDLGDLMRLAGFASIWQSETAAEAVVAILPYRSADVLVAELEEIVLHNPFTRHGFGDIAVSRWEARLGWEMMLALPEERREALLDGSTEGGRREKKLASKLGAKRLEKNLSWEYKESSRYDAYTGDDARTVTTTEVADDGTEREHTRETSEDTDREGLLARALDPELWEASDATRLETTVRMVVQAGSADVLGVRVAEHWERHGAFLEELGFSASGAWREVIHDETATGWLGRTWHGLWAVIDVVGSLVALGKVRTHTSLDLERITRAWEGTIGARLDDAPKGAMGPRDWLTYISGGADAIFGLLDWIGVEPPEFVKLIERTNDGAQWLLLRLHETEGFIEGAEVVAEMISGKHPDLAPDPHQGDANTLTIDRNDVDGTTVLTIPMLPIAAVANRRGAMAVRMGGSFLSGVQVEVKQATPFDPTRHVRVRIDAAEIRDLALIGDESMTTVSRLALCGLDVSFQAPDARPAALVDKLGTAVVHVSAQALATVPLGQFNTWAGIGQSAVQAGLGLADIMQFRGELMAITGGEWTSLGLAFESLAVDGIATSDGTAVDHIRVGETDLTLGVPVSGEGLLYAGDPEALRAELAERQQERSKVGGRLERASGKRAERLGKKASWLDGEIGRLRSQVEVAALSEENAADVAALEELQAQAGQQPSEDAKARIEALETRIRKRSAAIAMARTGGLGAEGHLGAVTVEGVDAGGVKLKSAELAKTTFESREGEGGRRETVVKTGKLELKQLELAGDRRRDVAIEQELAALRAKQAKAGKPPTREELERVEALETEARFLKPFVDEYVALRAGVETLTPEEVDRLLELRELLEAPATTTVDRITATDVSFGATTGDLTGAAGGDVTGAGGGEAGMSVEVVGLKQSDSARFLLSGHTAVDRMTVSGATAGVTTEDGLGANAKADLVEIGDVELQGRKDAAAEEVGRLEATLARSREELACLQERDTHDATAGARVQALEAQIAALESQIADIHHDVLDAPERFRGFVEAAKARLPELVGRIDGADRSRGASLAGARDSEKAAQDALAAARMGVSEADGELASYEAGIAELAAERADYEAQREALEGHADVKQQQQATLLAQLVAKRDGQLATAQGLLASWREKRAFRASEVARLKVALAEAQRVRAVYEDIVALAAEAGLRELSRSAGGPALAEASAFGLIHLAEAGAEADETMCIDAIVAEDVNLEVTTLGTWLSDGEGAVTVRGGGDGKQLAAAVEVRGVRSGSKTLLDDLTLVGFTGEVTWEPPGTLRVRGLGVEGLTFESLDWQSASMGVAAPSGLDVRGVSVDLTLHLGTTQEGTKDGVVTASTMTGVVDRVAVDRLSAPHMDIRYGDYLVGLGGGEGAAQAVLEDLVIAGFDLETGELAGLDAGTLKAPDLAVDLGAGMKVGARQLDAEAVHIGAVLTDAQREADEGAGKTPTAQRYEMSFGAVDAEQMRVAMETMGLDVTIEELKGGAIDGITVDFLTGDFALDGVTLDALALGPIRYASPAMSFTATGGMDLSTVRLKASGHMTTAAEMTAQRASGEPVASVSRFTIECLEAADAAFEGVVYEDRGEGGTQTIAVPRGSLKKLALRDYDLMAEAMALGLSFEDGSLEGFARTTKSALGTTVLQGNFDVGRLSFDAMTDANGDHMNVDFAGLKADEGFYRAEDRSPDRDGDPTETITTADGFSAKGGRGRVGMTSRADGSSTTTFSGLKLDRVDLPYLEWDGAGSGLEADLASLDGVSVDGRIETREETLRGMTWPVSDLIISHLHVDRVGADRVRYVDGAQVVTLRGRENTDGDMWISGIDVTDLKVIEGVAEEGRISADEVATDLTYWKHPLSDTLDAAAHLQASGLSVQFSGDAETGTQKAEFGLKTLDVESAVVDQVSEAGDALHVELPEATLSGLSGSWLSRLFEDDDEVVGEQRIRTKVDELVVGADAPFRYEAAREEIEWLDDEKPWAQRVSEAKTAAAIGRTLDETDWDAVLANLNGDVRFDLMTPLGVYEDLPIRIRNGNFDYEALEAALGGMFSVTQNLLDFEWVRNDQGQLVFTLTLDLPMTRWDAPLFEVPMDAEQGAAWEERGEIPLRAILDQQELLDGEVVDRGIAEILIDVDRRLSEEDERKVDAGAAEAREARLQRIQELRDRIERQNDFIARLAVQRGGRQNVPPRFIEERRQMIEDLWREMRPTEWEAERANDWASATRVTARDVHAHVWLGRDDRTTEIALGEGASMTYDTIDLNFDEVRDGARQAWRATLGLTNVGATATTAAGTTNVMVGEATGIEAQLAELFASGDIVVNGGLTRANPIAGTLRPDAKLKDVTVDFDFDARRWKRQE